MCGCYCIAFIEYMLAGKALLDCTNLFSSNDYKKNEKILHRCFKGKYVRRRSKFRWRKIVETTNYLLDEIKHNDLMSEKYKKTCKYLNYVEHVLFLASTITGSVSIFVFVSLVAISVVITSYAVGINDRAITAGIKKFKSNINRPSKSHGFDVRLTVLTSTHGLTIIDHFLKVISKACLVQINCCKI